jgi:hypothetical protein
MEIRITKSTYAVLKSVLSKKPFELRMNKEELYREEEWIDLAMYDEKTLLKLETAADAAAKSSRVRGLATIARDCRSWIAACKAVAGETGPRARSVRQMEGLLVQFLLKFPRRHVYERLQDGNEGVSLAYYVSEIQYHSKDTRRDGDPEHLIVKLKYRELGFIESTVFSMYPSDCLGMNAAEALHEKGYITETPELRADYEKFLALFEKHHGEIGRQFLAVGLADDEGVDGNEERGEDRWYHSGRQSNFRLDKDGSPSRVVVDVFHESDKDKKRYDASINTYFWYHQINKRPGLKDNDEEELEDVSDAEETADARKNIEVPTHPYVVCFDLRRHKRLRIHVGNMEPYKYDPQIRQKLILPARNAELIDTLLQEKESAFRDIIRGKSGGVLILSQGPPGTGKTLTAEVYAEASGRALYTVQCSQLGTSPDDLEDNLLKVLARGRRWGAIMLLDEADVYVTSRGTDLQLNAIVGVFLRVLEYHSGVLFMTTNRGDLVDDAILSRCTARIPFEAPPADQQHLIWEILTDSNGLHVRPSIIKEIVRRHPKLSGRDIKNLLKLAMMAARDRKCEITADLIDEVKIFKPTIDAN